MPPDVGYTRFRGNKGTAREGGHRVPAIAWLPGKINRGTDSHEIVGGIDILAAFASVAGVELPKRDRDGEPIVFDGQDMTPLLTDKADKWTRRK
ncbi:alkaline phosphatase family protein [Rhodopirellula europaea]|uniref:Uncharacterized protein n=1 Tax=Rhodopirellula europaea 6C TaxID=1263867 RepID=M2A8C7_9BACT|nr:sulfatase-like hydrolase/transferase [Rhodopirellula europaea]EMB18021.1 hypothetical protein RE6C_01265 [Rhodopirellula europaea 6C]